jgi:phosphomannomutase
MTERKQSSKISIQFKKDFPDAQITDDTVIPGDDGVRADYTDGMMVFRYSQNGPYITIKFEAKDQITFEKRRVYVREMLEKYPDMIWADQLCVNLDFIKPGTQASQKS